MIRVKVNPQTTPKAPSIPRLVKGIFCENIFLEISGEIGIVMKLGKHPGVLRVGDKVDMKNFNSDPYCGSITISNKD